MLDEYSKGGLWVSRNLVPKSKREAALHEGSSRRPSGDVRCCRVAYVRACVHACARAWIKSFALHTCCNPTSLSSSFVTIHCSSALLLYSTCSGDSLCVGALCEQCCLRCACVLVLCGTHFVPRLGPLQGNYIPDEGKRQACDGGESVVPEKSQNKMGRGTHKGTLNEAQRCSKVEPACKESECCTLPTALSYLHWDHAFSEPMNSLALAALSYLQPTSSVSLGRQRELKILLADFKAQHQAGVCRVPTFRELLRITFPTTSADEINKWLKWLAEHEAGKEEKKRQKLMAEVRLVMV